MPEEKSPLALKPLHGVVVAAVILGGFYFGVYAQRDKEKKALSKDVRELEEQLINARAVAQMRPVLEGQIDEMGKKLAFYERRLPNEKEVPKLLVELRRAVEEEGVDLLLLKTGDQENRGNYTTVPFNVEVNSGYHELGKFINRLESGERFLRVEDVAIASGRGFSRRESPSTRNTKLVVSTFWFNAPASGQRFSR